MELARLNCYEYVTVPYDKVRDALREDAAGLFQRATMAAARRAEAIVATLHVSVGALDINADVEIRVRGVRETSSALGEKAALVDLEWTAARGASLFPEMRATLAIYPLSRTETQLDLSGRYRPPFGVVGKAVDAVVGHRVAQASALHFVQEVAAQLEDELGS